VREVQDEDLYDERLAALVHAPVLFQELVEGVSVRSYVLDGKVVGAAEIRSKELDYRRDEGGVAPTSLNEMEESAARTAARVCRMGFAGVDLIRTRQGFRVLECNPSPMFSVFEKKTGLDIAGPLAESLAA
jgi:[lysine-biosynthesis-protein LysW]--L-2-aminoadipate ligase